MDEKKQKNMYLLHLQSLIDVSKPFLKCNYIFKNSMFLMKTNGVANTETDLLIFDFSWDLLTIRRKKKLQHSPLI